MAISFDDPPEGGPSLAALSDHYICGQTKDGFPVWVLVFLVGSGIPTEAFIGTHEEMVTYVASIPL